MMKAINFLSICLCAFIFSGKVIAQGFVFDEEQYEERETVEKLRGPIPSAVSFKRFTPVIYPQEHANCVAQSFANAMTILFARAAGMTNQEEITLLRPSPFFIYYSNKAGNDARCTMGLDAEKTAVNLLNRGVVPKMTVEYPNYYPFTNIVLCNRYPPVYQNDLQHARNTRPSNIYRIENLMDIKVALANGMPVVIGMMVPESFQYARSYLWTPKTTDNMQNSYGHAMTVVGYNDNLYGGSFEVMNSWGEDWGVNGYTHIRYRDAVNWIIAGWAVEWQQNRRFRYDGGFREKDEDLPAASDDMIRIFSEARQDTLIVNPFFQRDDLLDVFQQIND